MYTKLEIPRWANFKEIKSREKALTKLHHPDKAADPEKSRELLNDYKKMLDLLKNPTKRQIYDKYGEDPANLFELDGFNLEYYLWEIFPVKLL